MVLEVYLRNGSKIIELVGSNLYHILESLEIYILNAVCLFFSLYIRTISVKHC